MAVHAAFGGSTNLLLHMPAIAHAAGLPAPDGRRLDATSTAGAAARRRAAERPGGHPTVRVFLAGGVPEVMLHLRRLGLLDLDCLTVTGERLGRVLDWWENSERRAGACASALRAADGVDPDDVIMDPERARQRGLTSTVTFPRGNLAPEGSVIKSTAIDPSRRRRRRRVPQDRPRARLHAASAPRSPRSRAAAPTGSSRATSSCSSAAGRWARAWRRSTRSPPRSSTCRSASTSPC